MGGKRYGADGAGARYRIIVWSRLISHHVDYHVRRHDRIFAAINAVSESDATSRQQAAGITHAQHLNERRRDQFSVKITGLKANGVLMFPVLWNLGIAYVVGWGNRRPTGISGAVYSGNSPAALTEAYRDALLAQFTLARAHVIAGAGH